MFRGGGGDEVGVVCKMCGWQCESVAVSVTDQKWD